MIGSISIHLILGGFVSLYHTYKQVVSNFARTNLTKIEMRDSSNGMIEFLEVRKTENVYSSLIVVEKNLEKIKLQFGIDSLDYTLLKKIFEFRPFENTNVETYKYFFTFSYRKDDNNSELAFADIRIEQNVKNKQFEFILSRKFISNLL
jgi:hypothetical protein